MIGCGSAPTKWLYKSVRYKVASACYIFVKYTAATNTSKELTSSEHSVL